MPTITVIVPVYKVEQYLSACVDSILSQTFHDFELILIDDGSPDHCGAICEHYAEKDQRIKVIHQENQGLSGARNSGMDIATGKYITFVDSDDVVTQDYFFNMISVIEKENADIAVCQMYKFEDGVDISEYLCKKEKELNYRIYNGREACVALYSGSRDVPINACGKFFRAELVNKRRFPVGKLHEDQAFTPLICYKADIIAALNLQLYCYRERSGSITREKFSVKRYDDLWAIDSCIRFFEVNYENEILEAAKKKRQRLICTYSIYAKRDRVVVPEKYRVNILRALIYLRKNVSDESYEYYLGQVNMKLVRCHEYLKKARKIVKNVREGRV